MSDSEVLNIPNQQLPQHAWTLSQPEASSSHASARTALLVGIRNDSMGPYYAALASAQALPLDEALLKELREKNKEELEALEAKHKDALENLGETEVAEALKAKAQYLARIGEKEQAIAAYEETISKTAGLASKIDLRLSIIRVLFFHSDLKAIAPAIATAQTLIDQGGDWDRRNRLKVYQGLYALATRDFKLGATLFLDTLSTFTATELIEYNEYVGLAIIAGTFACDRKDLKKKIIESPEVIASLAELPHLEDFTTSLYNSSYSRFFSSLAKVEEHHLKPHRWLSVHTRYYVREMRIKAYAQFLESYRSVTLASLGHAFGVNEEFVDADLARFIASGRLPYAIDKVNGVVETTSKSLDPRSLKYEQVIRSSDVLLNNIQRLSRVVG